MNVRSTPTALPDWIKLGAIQSSINLRDLVRGGISSVAAKLPVPDATHRDWIDAAKRLAETIYRFHELPSEDAAVLRTEMRELQLDADDRLKDWVQRRFQDLPSLPVAKAPVMVHHIPRYLSMRRDAGEERSRLWCSTVWPWISGQIEYLNSPRGFHTEETVASMASQPHVGVSPAVFWLRPRVPSVDETTASRAFTWSRFWLKRAAWRRSLLSQGTRGPNSCRTLTRRFQPSIKVVGIVVDMIDELVHGASSVNEGCGSDTRVVRNRLVGKLLNLLIAKASCLCDRRSWKRWMMHWATNQGRHELNGERSILPQRDVGCVGSSEY